MKAAARPGSLDQGLYMVLIHPSAKNCCTISCFRDYMDDFLRRDGGIVFLGLKKKFIAYSSDTPVGGDT